MKPQKSYAFRDQGPVSRKAQLLPLPSESFHAGYDSFLIGNKSGLTSTGKGGKGNTCVAGSTSRFVRNV